MLIVVLLPAPLGPSSPKISPLLMLNEMPCTASILSKVLTRSSTCTTAGRPSFDGWIGPILGGYDSCCSTNITPSMLSLARRQHELGDDRHRRAQGHAALARRAAADGNTEAAGRVPRGAIFAHQPHLLGSDAERQHLP